MTNRAPKVQAEVPEELVYAAAVLILSEDLYPRKLEVIREYIQNASDALDDYRLIADTVEDRWEPVIKVSIQGRSLLIFDTGTGMDTEEMAKLKRIAYSEKKQGEEAGYKGIGRLAGIAVADKLKVTSTSYGDPRLHHFEFRAGEMREDVSKKKKSGVQEPASVVINRHTSLWTTDADDPESHYTLVELRDVRENCLDILDVDDLKEYIADIAPVDFAPDAEFRYGSLISTKLRQNLPDYSPKGVYLATSNGERIRIHKPYSNETMLSAPEFIEVRNPDKPQELLAYCWYASKGREMLGKVRPAGRIFSVDGEDAEEKHRLAGLVYKLFGFSIGDRSLPQRTLWTTTLTRAQWFTGEIHIVDKSILPTTDRSNFVENEWREKLYSQARDAISSTLNREAQKISDNRQAFETAEKVKKSLEQYQKRLTTGQIDRADLKAVREHVTQGLDRLRRREGRCRDTDILNQIKKVKNLGSTVKQDLADPKLLKKAKSVADIAAELKMAPKTRKVFEIIMDTLQGHFTDTDEYHRVAGKIYGELRKKY
ncbi:MAG TPA: ATP-binding protein [Bryobacteraceae bacterium]